MYAVLTAVFLYSALSSWRHVVLLHAVLWFIMGVVLLAASIIMDRGMSLTAFNITARVILPCIAMSGIGYACRMAGLAVLAWWLQRK